MQGAALPPLQNLRRRAELFGQAVAQDPLFARAYAALAETRTDLFYFGHGGSHLLADAEREAERALALDSTLGHANAVLGAVYGYQGRWARAEEQFRLALAQDTSDLESRIPYICAVKMSVGHHRTSLDLLQTAAAHAPANIRVLSLLAVVNSFLGRDTDSVRYVDLAVDLGVHPNMYLRPLIYSNAALRAQRHAEAAEYMLKALPAAALANNDAERIIRQIYAAAADPRQSLEAIAGLQELERAGLLERLGAGIRLLVIEWYTLLGALDAAYETADRMLELRTNPGVVGIARGPLWLPELRAFRQDSRFTDLAVRLGLLEYWQEYGPPDDCELVRGRLLCK